MIICVVAHALYVACTGTNTEPTALGVPYDYNKAVRELWGLHYACRLHFSYRLICGWWRYSLPPKSAHDVGTLRNRRLSFQGRGALCGPMRAQTWRGELGMAGIGRVGYVTITPHKGIR